MSGTRFLLDTNVLIGLLGGAKWAAEFFEKNSDEEPVYLVSSVTRMELLGFPEITDEESERIVEVLNELSLIPIRSDVEDMAISLRRESKLKLPDAIIAATAMLERAILVTADQRLRFRPESERQKPRLGGSLRCANRPCDDDDDNDDENDPS